MSLIKSDKEIKASRKASLEGLVRLLLDRDESHTENMEQMTKAINQSLIALKMVNDQVQSALDGNNSITDVQKEISQAIKLLSNTKTKNTDYLTKKDFSAAIRDLSKTIDNKEIVNSIKELNKKIETNTNKQIEWEHTIMQRDSTGKAYKIRTKQIN